ncbi:16S rRNA (uracil(1498)-N(3))-methyltransferase [Paenibacillus larvae subsp. pulvifaciens]|uniref:Ribosomal RNA small subunit methyltransferase E n=2 Tax=Paenibacillus larvae TaxID=1464 RepID=A0A1V0UPS3_9BACL|nr:16S rRNA (uracil(1498)-N(3))-methyltransferase [Paenibacillus larvae]ARF67174.1 16S rRNA (uracil(1498)-N(3))-methyltransferase [Paenibacillus larvae subsp. pulvifaciens]
MQRYFIPKEQFGSTSVRIEGDDAHHLVRVMRAQAGNKIIVSDGLSREALAQITEVDKAVVTAAIIEERPMTAEPRIQVWVAQSLPKADKMETVIQKGTEIGAARFLPFVSERTVVQYDAKKETKRTQRWQKIAKEAAEQAHRNRIPVVEGVHSWKQILEQTARMDAAWICYEKEDSLQIRDALFQADALKRNDDKPVRIMLIVGPEGGFTEKEIEQAEESGCRSIGLGTRILRTETAAMVGLTCILYETGEIGGK